MQINLYNEAFELYKHLLTKGQVLYIEGIYEKGYNSDRVFFKAKDIRMLDTIGKNLTKSVTIKIPLHIIDEKLVHEIEQICIDKEGPHTLKLKIVDGEDEYGIDLIATSKKVSADYQFIQGIETLGLAYKLN